MVDLLLTDETNPRSVIYQVDALTRHIEMLPRPEHGLRGGQERIALGVLTDLKLCDVERVTDHGDDGRRTRLSEMLIDLATQIGDKLPLMIAIVVGLSFVVLLLAFRSLLVPLKAAAMNLLSVAAAYGVVTAVFQLG